MKINDTKLEDFLKDLDSYKIVGTRVGMVKNISAISDGTEGSFTWLNPSRKDKNKLISETNATFIVMNENEPFLPKDSQTFIKVQNAKLFYVKALSRYLHRGTKAFIHPTAIISSEAVIHQTASVGAFCLIEKCTIGEGTVIESHCKIGQETIIGKRVRIASGVIVGSDGFGFVEDEGGLKIKFPHIGGVVIGNDVEIGANTCVDRGTLGNTVIKEGAKIDNLVHIAHNVIIGQNSVVIANAMIGGSTVVGDHAWVAPSATLRDGISIGYSSVVGLGALVTKSIPDHQVWAGFPAKYIRKNE